jgi:hypothetical protein
MPKYVKPTLQTKFHIDFNWWSENLRNFHSVLLDSLCDDCRDLVDLDADAQLMDWVDPETAQVFLIDQLWHIIQVHCSQDAEFVSDQLPLATAIFRLFIANNNTPLTPVEIHQHIRKRDAGLILRTIAGRQVYRGIRAVVPLISN